MRTQHPFLKGAGNRHHGPGFFPVKGVHVRKPFPEFGQPHRHQRRRLGGGIQGAQIVQGLFKHVPVVEAGAQHDLAVKMQPGVRKGF